ncbi:MAG TPA: hypothetical protein ENI64_00775 [Gammaproteobacteria bacterium]|nr:hypothetical protein [Gammaproteobacteria bacterium]
MTQKTSSNSYTLLVNISLLLTLITIILSAYIRLSVNGLGCEDWPDCYGYVGPVSQYSPAASFTDAAPEKPHGVARAMHRVVASVLGVFVVLVLVIAIRLRKKGGPGITMPLAVFALTVFLSVLGYSTPSPWVPAVTLGNLLGGMLMLALLWWMGQQSVASGQPPVEYAPALKPWALLGAVLLIVQISSGAWVSANFAGPACPEITVCEGSILPASGLSKGFSIFRELQVDTAGRIKPDDSMPAINMVHRASAVLCFLFLLWLAIKVISTDRNIRSTGIVILVLLFTQVGLGMASVILALPLGLVTAHNATAALLLLAVTNLNQVLFRKS